MFKFFVLSQAFLLLVPSICNGLLREGDRQPGVSGCVFPFFYRNQLVNDCVFGEEEPYTESGWCSTTDFYDLDEERIACWSEDSRLLVQDDYVPCVFPFTYKQTTYWDCGHLFPDSPQQGQCSTTGNLNHDRRYRNCTESDHPTGSVMRGMSGCIFPFYYNNIPHHDCLYTNKDCGDADPYGWCSNTGDYDRDRSRRWCWIPGSSPIIRDDDDVPCVFPFKYLDVMYNTCIQDLVSLNLTEPSQYGHCATTANLNADRAYRSCSPFDDPSGLTPDRFGCVYPFLYNGEAQTEYIVEETEDGFPLAWCSTTNNYDRDGKWKRCWTDNLPIALGYLGEPTSFGCVFPFWYLGSFHEDCVFDGDGDERSSGWCSLTNNYDRDGQKKQCWEEDDLHLITSDFPATPCTFPFTYKDTIYNQCEDIFGQTPLGQCATTSNLNVDRQYRNCTKYDIPSYPKGRFYHGCQIPFLYNGTIYNDCTNDGHNDFWCSLTNNYDRDQRRKSCFGLSDWYEKEQHAECVFPFKYLDRSVSTCINHGMLSLYNNRKFFCATTSNLNLDRRYKICNPQQIEKSFEVKTVSGKKCRFPFTGPNGETNLGCRSIYSGSSTLWCENEDGEFEICLQDGNEDLVSRPPVRTYTNSQCHFPFTHRGHTYAGCTSDHHPRKKLWCRVSASHLGVEDTPETTFDLCKVKENVFVTTHGGNLPAGTKCHFPFIFIGVVVHGCTSNSDGDYYWCSNTYDFDTDRKWGYCDFTDTDTNLKKLARERPPAHPVKLQYVDDRTPAVQEKRCKFPFVYDNKEHYGCTGWPLWCSTDYKYKDNWKKCTTADALLGKNPERYDIFKDWQTGTYPYEKNNVVTYDIMSYKEYDRVYTKYFYQSQRTFVSSAPRPNRENCVLPFKYENEVYFSCAEVSPSSEQDYWCPTNPSFLADPDNSDAWKWCGLLDVNDKDFTVEKLNI